MEEDVTSCTPSTLVLFTVEIAGAAFLGRYLHQPPHESDPTVNGREVWMLSWMVDLLLSS